MTPEERNARRRKYKDDILANPFRRKQYADYFRNRRKRPGMRERTNAQARARYNADVEKNREYNRAKYRKMMDDPARRARTKNAGASGVTAPMAKCRRLQNALRSERS